MRTTESKRLRLRPIVCRPGDAPDEASRPLAGGPLRFGAVEAFLGAPGAASVFQQILPIDGLGPLEDAAASAGLSVDAVSSALGRASAAPKPFAGLSFDRPRIMAVVNVTPDSFSDGGEHLEPARAVDAALGMIEDGADMLDVGAESTRPGADTVSAEEELDRLGPVLEGLRAARCSAPISIDTRKPEVARAAFAAGAVLWNDVAALDFAPESIATAADLTRSAPETGLCLMHAQGEPKTMQRDPRYAHVLLEVADWLEERRAAAVAAGSPDDRILLDPGLGFGKRLEHNLALMRGLSLFVALGRPVLLGASRKRMIGALSGEADARARAPGSVAAALAGLSQGARVLRMHDVRAAAQAVRVWTALNETA